MSSPKFKPWKVCQYCGERLESSVQFCNCGKFKQSFKNQENWHYVNLLVSILEIISFLGFGASLIFFIIEIDMREFPLRSLIGFVSSIIIFFGSVITRILIAIELNTRNLALKNSAVFSDANNSSENIDLLA